MVLYNITNIMSSSPDSVFSVPYPQQPEHAWAEINSLTIIWRPVTYCRVDDNPSQWAEDVSSITPQAGNVRAWEGCGALQGGGWLRRPGFRSPLTEQLCGTPERQASGKGSLVGRVRLCGTIDSGALTVLDE